MKTTMIPTNEPSKKKKRLVEQNRFRGLVPVLETMNALVVGCGSLGSHLIAMLARMRPESITCVDHDDVSRENLGVQNFSSIDLGKNKALQTSIINTEVPVIPFSMKFEVFAESGMLRQRVNKFTHLFMCVDSMKSRTAIFKYSVKMCDYNGILVDGRLDANVGWVYACKHQGTGGDWYSKMLHSDDEVIEVANSCAIQMTGYSAHVVAGMMIAQAMRLSQDGALNNQKCGIDLNHMLFFPAEREVCSEA